MDLSDPYIRRGISSKTVCVLSTLRNICRPRPLILALVRAKWFQSLKAGAEVTIFQALGQAAARIILPAVGSGLVGSNDVKLQHGMSKHCELTQSSRWPCGQNSCVLLVLTSTPEAIHHLDLDPDQDE